MAEVKLNGTFLGLLWRPPYVIDITESAKPFATRLIAQQMLSPAVLYKRAPAAMRAVLREYRGLEHRLEPAGIVEGVEFVNDSKATNLDSLAVALESFEQPVVLIAGGRDKGQDFGTMREAAR